MQHSSYTSRTRLIAVALKFDGQAEQPSTFFASHGLNNPRERMDIIAISLARAAWRRSYNHDSRETQRNRHETARGGGANAEMVQCILRGTNHRDSRSAGPNDGIQYQTRPNAQKTSRREKSRSRPVHADSQLQQCTRPKSVYPT